MKHNCIQYDKCASYTHARDEHPQTLGEFEAAIKIRSFRLMNIAQIWYDFKNTKDINDLNIVSQLTYERIKADLNLYQSMQKKLDRFIHILKQQKINLPTQAQKKASDLNENLLHNTQQHELQILNDRFSEILRHQNKADKKHMLQQLIPQSLTSMGGIADTTWDQYLTMFRDIWIFLADKDLQTATMIMNSPHGTNRARHGHLV